MDGRPNLHNTSNVVFERIVIIFIDLFTMIAKDLHQNDTIRIVNSDLNGKFIPI
jgi:hypothetical protein